MKIGDIVLIPFPFAEQNKQKVRPTAVICETADAYKDLVVCAISSVVPQELSANEILIKPDNFNNLRAISVIKVDRIVTIKRQDVIAQIGILQETDLEKLKNTFKKLVS